MKYVVSNLDCEYAWMLKTGWQPPVQMQKRMENWAAALRLIPGWEDASPLTRSDGVDPDRVLSWARDRRLGHDESEVECAINANSKIFSVSLETEFGQGLPGTLISDDLEEILAHTQHGTWLIKHPLGVSGRERIEVRDGEMGNGIGWLRGAVAQTKLVVEPRLKLHSEWSMQFDIQEECVFLGSIALLTDARGQHRGHRLDLEVPATWVMQAEQAMEQVRTLGYRGPVGVDGYEGELDGKPVTRVLGEINARFTFGRLALELRRFVPKGPVVWWHPSPRLWPPEKTTRLETVSVHSMDGIYRLPEFVDPAGRSGSVVVVGEQEILRTLPGDPKVVV